MISEFFSYLNESMILCCAELKVLLRSKSRVAGAEQKRRFVLIPEVFADVLRSSKGDVTEMSDIKHA